MKLRPSRERDEARVEALKGAVTDTKRVNANIPLTLHRRLKMAAAARGVDMTAIIVEALEKQLAE